MLAYPSKYVHVRYLYRGLMSYSKARIRDVEDLNPRFRRLVFDVDDLGRLSLPGVADEAVGLYVPSACEHDVPDMSCRDGVWAFHDIDIAPQGRNYSIRHLDAAAGSVVIDVVIHSTGPVTEFAQRVRPGDRVTMSHARGWYRPPPETDWQILVADLAGLPALARILTESDDDASLIVVTELGDPSDVELLPEFAGTHLSDVGGNGYTPSRLAARMRDLDLPPGRGYCWFAGEAAESRSVRKYVRSELGSGRDDYDIIGYWRHDGERWSRQFEERGNGLFDVYRRAIADGKTEKQAAEEFDEALERAGL